MAKRKSEPLVGELPNFLKYATNTTGLMIAASSSLVYLFLKFSSRCQMQCIYIYVI